MKGKPRAVEDPDGLRRRAEKRLAESLGGAVAKANTKAEAQRLVHELQVHQIELELQNEELLRAREEVEDGLARYTELYEFAPVGYLTVNREGVIQQVNLTGTRLLDLARSQLIGRRLGLLVAGEDGPDFDAFLANVFEREVKATCEVAVVSDDSAPRYCELTGTVTPGGQEGRIVVTDITERRRAEAEREELQAQLARAQRLEAIGTFAGGIAHDFNNILAGILGGLSLLELDLDEASAHRADFQEMEALVERGAELTRQLLGFARLGKYDVRPLDLARVVHKTSAMFGRTHKGITIHIDMAPGLQAVLMDHSQLEQILMNLLVNAGQAMGESGQLYLKAENAVGMRADPSSPGAVPGRFVKLEVADTGSGMDAATQARIFDPFFTTKEPGEGTGLGLASVYGIVRSHGGSITAASEPGKGATFTLLLPATDRKTPPEVAPTTAAIPRGIGTILVVDDEEQVLKTYAALLQRVGYDVLAAAGGEQALEYMRQRGSDISLVILDMIMPGMSGSQAYDAIQKIAPGTKVLLASGYSIDSHTQVVLDRGCVGFIQKPFRLAELSAKLQEFL